MLTYPSSSILKFRNTNFQKETRNSLLVNNYILLHRVGEYHVFCFTNRENSSPFKLLVKVERIRFRRAWHVPEPRLLIQQCDAVILLRYRPFVRAAPSVALNSTPLNPSDLTIGADMARVEILTLTSTSQLVNLNGLYFLGYAWLFGMCTSTNSIYGSR